MDKMQIWGKILIVGVIMIVDISLNMFGVYETSKKAELSVHSIGMENIKRLEKSNFAQIELDESMKEVIRDKKKEIEVVKIIIARYNTENGQLKKDNNLGLRKNARPWRNQLKNKEDYLIELQAQLQKLNNAVVAEKMAHRVKTDKRINEIDKLAGSRSIGILLIFLAWGIIIPFASLVFEIYTPKPLYINIPLQIIGSFMTVKFIKNLFLGSGIDDNLELLFPIVVGLFQLLAIPIMRNILLSKIKNVRETIISNREQIKIVSEKINNSPDIQTASNDIPDNKDETVKFLKKLPVKDRRHAIEAAACKFQKSQRTIYNWIS